MAPGLVALSRALVLSVGITASVSAIALAQAPVAPGSGANPSKSAEAPLFARAIQGQNVWVTADGARVRGRVTSLSPASLVLVEDGVPTTIAYDRIVRVEKSTHRLRNGTLIGMAAGAGFVLTAVGILGCEDCGPEIVGVAAAWAGIGAGAGIGIGAILNAAKKDTDVLYDARRSSTRTIALAPIVSPTRKGMAFSMTWR